MRKLITVAILLSFVVPASAGHRYKARAGNMQMQRLMKLVAPLINNGGDQMPSIEGLPQGIIEQLSQVQERMQEMMGQ